MKSIIFLLITSLVINFGATAQIDTTIKTYQLNPNLLFKKAKSQKTAAWIMLVGGTGLFIAGESKIMSEDMEEMSNGIGAALVGIVSLGTASYNPAPVKHSSGARVIAYTGLGAMLGSIPLFISAHKNKKQAKLFIKDQTIMLSPLENSKQLAVGLKFNL